METLTAQELRDMQQTDADFTLINVLAEPMHEKKHIPGSINIPVVDKNFVNEVEQEVGDKSRPVVVYCADHECEASPKAGRQLENAGFENVYDFEGGIDEWEQEDFPLEGSEVEQTSTA
jgi:rhodanese-related sulfurtransferase